MASGWDPLHVLPVIVEVVEDEKGGPTVKDGQPPVCPKA